MERFGVVCDGKFDKPTETRSVVTWRAAAVLEGRCVQVLSGFCFRVGTAQTAWEPVYKLFTQKPYVMLSNPLVRVRCKFSAALGERVLFRACTAVRSCISAPDRRRFGYIAFFPCERRGHR